MKIKKTPTASNPKGKKDVASQSKSAVQSVTKTKNIKTSKTDFSTTKAKDITPCSTCLVKFCDDTSGGTWIQCQHPNCQKWYHCSCQGVEEKGLTVFFCIECDDSD